MTEPKTITLSKPLKFGDSEIVTVTINAPRPSQLRGLSLIDILKLDTNAIGQLLPRVTEPGLDPSQIDELSLADFTAMAVALQGFFSPSSATVN